MKLPTLKFPEPGIPGIKALEMKLPGIKLPELNLPGTERLGLIGVAGIGLLFFSLSFYVASVAPVLRELAGVQATKSRLLAASSGFGAQRLPGGAAAGQALPAFAESPEIVRQLHQLASRHGASVERISSELKSSDGMRRLEVSLPLRIGYPALRAYLVDAIRITPGASIEALSLQRKLATDTVLEVQLRISYGFSAAP